MNIHRGDREMVWDEGKRAPDRCSDTEEKVYPDKKERLTVRSAPLGHHG